MLIELINFEPSSYSMPSCFTKLQAAENLFACSGQRKHIVLAKRKALKDIVNKKSLIGTVSEIYANDMLELRQEIRGLQEDISVYIEVDFNSTAPVTVRKNTKKTIICCGYNFFSNSSTCDATFLLAENKDDFDLYLLIAELFAKHTHDARLNVNFQLAAGGGSTIKSLFDRNRTNQIPTLCLLDTDKKHPNGPLGSTAGSFNKADFSIAPIGLAYMINAHELECLVPYEIINDTFVDVGSSVQQIENLDALNSFSVTEFRRYFDHKNGLSIKDAIDLDYHYRPYWLPILSTYKRWGQKPCIQNSTCYTCNECPKITGLGGGMLSSVVNYLSTQHIRQYKDKIEGFLAAEWLELGQLLLSWGCIISSRLTKV